MRSMRSPSLQGEEPTRVVKTAIWVDPMGSMSQTPEEQVDYEKRAFEEELGVELDVHTPQCIGDIEVGTDLVLFDFGGMMSGNSLCEDNCRHLLRWAENNPSSLLVIISDFTYNRAFRYVIADHMFEGASEEVQPSYLKVEGGRHKTPVHNITVEHWGEDFIPTWFRESIGAKPFDKEALVERDLVKIEDTISEPDDLPVGTLPSQKFFEPTQTFVSCMAKRYGKRLIYDVGAGLGHVAAALHESKAFKKVVALDLNAREDQEFIIKHADATKYHFHPSGVVMFCRPCHGVFVEHTMVNAIQCGVKDIVYIGLVKNSAWDLGSLVKKFRRLRSGKIGKRGEKLWVYRA